MAYLTHLYPDISTMIVIQKENFFANNSNPLVF